MKHQNNHKHYLKEKKSCTHNSSCGPKASANSLCLSSVTVFDRSVKSVTSVSYGDSQ